MRIKNSKRPLFFCQTLLNSTEWLSLNCSTVVQKRKKKMIVLNRLGKLKIAIKTRIFVVFVPASHKKNEKNQMKQYSICSWLFREISQTGIFSRDTLYIIRCGIRGLSRAPSRLRRRRRCSYYFKLSCIFWPASKTPIGRLLIILDRSHSRCQYTKNNWRCGVNRAVVIFLLDRPIQALHFALMSLCNIVALRKWRGPRFFYFVITHRVYCFFIFFLPSVFFLLSCNAKRNPYK